VSERLLVSTAEAAQRLGIGRTLLWRLLQTGELPSMHIGDRRLIAVADLEAFVERQREAVGVR
jgi:excisionase family DNA binding protein